MSFQPSQVPIVFHIRSIKLKRSEVYCCRQLTRFEDQIVRGYRNNGWDSLLNKKTKKVEGNLVWSWHVGEFRKRVHPAMAKSGACQKGFNSLLLPVADIGLHKGELCAAGWGEGPWQWLWHGWQGTRIRIQPSAIFIKWHLFTHNCR